MNHLNAQLEYFRFVAKFVDAVVTEPLQQELRRRPAPLRLHSVQRPTVELPEIPRAA